MNTIRENDLNRVDLNLLIVLLVLHREGSVSRAASKLHLGQPAVSGALLRLREIFNDPLFVRTAKGMAPTPRAQALVTALLPVMEQMQEVIFQAPVFSPEQDQHTFRLGMSDWVERWLMPGVMADIAQTAPGIRLQVTASDPFQDGEQVLQDKVDVAISVVEQVPAGVVREMVTRMGFCTVWHPVQLSLKSPLDLDAYGETDHLLVSYRGASSSPIDQLLADCGRKREVRYVTPNFSSLPLLLKQIPALATVPQGLAAGWKSDYGLQFADVPLEVPPFTLSLLWNKRRDNDAALCWLLEKLRVRMQGWEVLA